MLWESKNNKNASETAQKNFSIFCHCCQVENLLSKFRSGDTSLRDKSTTDLSKMLQGLVDANREKVLKN